MILNLLSKYKWLLIVLLVIIYTIGVANVVTKYVSAGHTEAMLQLEQEKNKALNENLKLRDSFDAKLAQELAKRRPIVNNINKEIQREIQTNTVYRDCKSSDSVRDNYNKLLETQ